MCLPWTKPDVYSPCRAKMLPADGRCPSLSYFALSVLPVFSFTDGRCPSLTYLAFAGQKCYQPMGDAHRYHISPFQCYPYSLLPMGVAHR